MPTDRLWRTRGAGGGGGNSTAFGSTFSKVTSTIVSSGGAGAGRAMVATAAPIRPDVAIAAVVDAVMRLRADASMADGWNASNISSGQV